MTMAFAVSPRFGWHRTKPPSAEIRFSPADIRNLQTLEPTDSFTEKVAEKLVGDSDESPRFAVIPGLLSTLGSAVKARIFQWQVSRAVFEKLSRRDPDRFGVWPGFYPALHAQYRSHSEPLTELHQDGGGVLVSLTYGQNKGLEGGAPRLADVRQFCRDAKTTLMSVRGKPRDNYLRPDVDARVLKDYAIDIDDLEMSRDMGMVILNNTDDGVFHAGAPARKTAGTLRPTRPLGVIRISNNESEPASVAVNGFLQAFFDGQVDPTFRKS